MWIIELEARVEVTHSQDPIGNGDSPSCVDYGLYLSLPDWHRLGCDAVRSTI